MVLQLFYRGYFPYAREMRVHRFLLFKVRPGSCQSDCRKHNIHAHLGYTEYYTLKLKLQQAKPLASFMLLYIVSYLEQKETFALREIHTSNNLYICLNRRRPTHD